MDNTDSSGECIDFNKCAGNPFLLDSAKATTKQQLPEVTITATRYAAVYDPPLQEVHPEALLIPGSALATGALDSAAIIAIVGNIFKPKGEGIETASGSRITGFTRHGVNRAIGDAAKRAGTKPKAISDALRNPTKPVVRGVDSQAGRLKFLPVKMLA